MDPSKERLRTIKHVALDVHQATVVASMREEIGRVVARSVLPTNVRSLVASVEVSEMSGFQGAAHPEQQFLALRLSECCDFAAELPAGTLAPADEKL